MLKARTSRLVVGVFGVVLMLALLQCPVYAASQQASTLSLTITNVSATGITQTSAIISWTTNSNATSQVFCDTQSHDDADEYDYHTTADTTLVTEHMRSLSSLSSSTTYHYRVKSVASGDGSIAISEDRTFRTRSTQTQGYSHYPTIRTIVVDICGLETALRIGDDGEVLETVEAISEDGRLIIRIPEGTIALDSNGRPLGYLEASVDESPPPPPEGTHIIGLAYDFRPSGAIFDPPITIEYRYDPSEILPGVEKENLVIAYYNEELGTWVECPPCTCDTETHCVMASICHLTLFAIMAYPASPEAAPEPELAPEPAAPPPTPEPPQPTPMPEPQPTPTPEPHSAPTPLGITWGILGSVLGKQYF